MDDRFAHISSDPQFRTTPKSVRKVKIDKRFQSLFTDKRFQLKYSVDKRGKPLDQSSNENFRKYYDLSSDDESSEDEKNENSKTVETNEENEDEIETSSHKESKGKISSKSNKWVVTTKSNKSEEKLKEENNSYILNGKNDIKGTKKVKSEKILDDSDTIEKQRMTDEIKMKLRDPNIDYARGVGALLSESSSDEESSAESESESEEEFDHGWGELDRDADTTDEATDRVAVLHMDWDRIRAVDLMVLFNSFLPQDGVIESVTIYPSQFGLERMKEEEEKGPPELVSSAVKNEEELDDEADEGKRYHMEKLRQYQLNRLKYYYAVIKFDSAETANKVYNECDGLEYESSATKLDLRFVPEDETFDQEPHDVCTSMPDPSRYQPRVFTNTALQQGKVELTWDETDPGRQEFTKKIQKNADHIDNMDLQAYLAYSSEDEEENKDEPKKEDSENEEEDIKEEDKIAKYKSLLVSLEEEEKKKKNRDVDLEITWGLGLKEKAEKSIKEKMNTPQTPFEEMLEKRKQKRKMKREKKLKKKEKNEKSSDEDDLYSDDDVPSDIDMNDSYFKEELSGANLKKKKKEKNKEEDECPRQNEAELELLLLDEDESEKQKRHFNIKSIQEQENESKKKKRRKQLKKKSQEVIPEKDDFQIDVADDRFGALFTSHHFNIDPADPQYRKTKAMDNIISEKLKRRQQIHEQEMLPPKQMRTDPELSKLTSSIKKKMKHKIWK